MATRKKKQPPARLTPTHRAPADEHAATELVLYIENTSDLSPDGPSGQGRSVLLNALRKWRRGVYDPTQAVRLFEYLTESGAKRYAKEFDSEKNWSTIFTPATRHEAAKQLEASFRHSVEHGEYDHVDTKIGARETAEKVNAKNKITAHTYSMPAYWASYLINGDPSSLDDKEIAEADAAIEDIGMGSPVDVSDSEFRSHGDYGRLAGDYADYTFLEHGEGGAHKGVVKTPKVSHKGKRRPIQVGDTVRFTKKFLQNTGQYTGHDANGRWEVLEVRGSFALVNQPADTSYFTPEELQADPMLKWRMINVGNLEVA